MNSNGVDELKRNIGLALQDLHNAHNLLQETHNNLV